MMRVPGHPIIYDGKKNGGPKWHANGHQPNRQPKSKILPQQAEKRYSAYARLEMPNVKILRHMTPIRERVLQTVSGTVHVADRL
jgi:hypothetical protein